MDENIISEIRNYLVSKLETYEGEPILLNIDKDILHKLIFTEVLDEYSDYRKKIFGLSTEILKKIDFSNISFDGVDVIDIDFTGMKGVHLDPQTISNKSLLKTKLSFLIISNLSFSSNSWT